LGGGIKAVVKNKRYSSVPGNDRSRAKLLDPFTIISGSNGDNYRN